MSVHLSAGEHVCPSVCRRVYSLSSARISSRTAPRLGVGVGHRHLLRLRPHPCPRRPRPTVSCAPRRRQCTRTRGSVKREWREAPLRPRVSCMPRRAVLGPPPAARRQTPAGLPASRARRRGRRRVRAWHCSVACTRTPATPRRVAAVDTARRRPATQIRAADTRSESRSGEQQTPAQRPAQESSRHPLRDPLRRAADTRSETRSGEQQTPAPRPPLHPHTTTPPPPFPLPGRAHRRGEGPERPARCRSSSGRAHRRGAAPR
jgi:hypothetical protein